VWRRKPILQHIYGDWYRRLVPALKPGSVIEIGGGTGNFKEFYPDAITSDIVFLPWLNVVLDAHRLPFKNARVDNVVLFDVLHHLENPIFFFEELLRVLTPGGRAHFLEPYISPFSYPVYHWFHPEPVDLGQNPFTIRQSRRERAPFEANQAVPYLIFFRYRKRFQQHFPDFKVVQRRRISLWAYPLSGGFDHPALVPDNILGGVQAIEGLFAWLAPVAAFRLLVILEKAVM
jgi:SAM-dependent methyltransferase